MKKINLFFLFAFLILLGFPLKIDALEKNYVNENGVSLTEKEMKFVNNFYGASFFETMTEEDYEWISELDVNHLDVEIESAYYGITTRATTSTTYQRKISIAKSCSSTCTIITNVSWINNPSVRSYDIIGVRFENTSLSNNTIETKVTSTSGTTYFSNNKILSNGLGCSVKLPTNANNISIQQKITMKKSGRVYASYQHSTTSISLLTSQQYTIGDGLGSVFVLKGDAVGKFDLAKGVSIDL